MGRKLENLSGMTFNGEHISLYYGNSKEEAIRKRKEAEILYYDRAKETK